MRQRLSVDEYTKGILSCDRVILSRAITILESKLDTDRVLAKEILTNILPHTGKAIRLGITGVPGVGKSTFIEAFGKFLTLQGKKVGVLTIDPSSQRSGGSILGDKTRMEKLAHNSLAYIRPTATGRSLGGVADNTREAMLLCEAAGFEVIIIETVGVGQSETLVHGMTDFFILLMLAGAGDELQGIKKGIMEMADAVVINKADGTNRQAAAQAVHTYQSALHLAPKTKSGHVTQVTMASAIEETGISELWEIILAYQKMTSENGYFYENRQAQNLEWMNSLVIQTLNEMFSQDSAVRKNLAAVQKRVMEGKELPGVAAEKLLSLFLSGKK